MNVRKKTAVRAAANNVIPLIALLLLGLWLLKPAWRSSADRNRPDSTRSQTTTTAPHPEDGQGRPPRSDASTSAQAADNALKTAFDNQQSGVQVQAEGVVTRILSDDLDGSRHQRFILRLRTGQTVLISHNIDVAPRIEDLKTGDRVEFYGQYEWNAKGGTVHWTHHDPDGSHMGGWLKHRARTYQ